MTMMPQGDPEQIPQEQPAGAEMAQAALDWLFSLPRDEQQQVRDEIRAAVAQGEDYVAALMAAYEEATGGAPTGEEAAGMPQDTSRLQSAIYGG